MRHITCALLLLSTTRLAAQTPADWIDPATGHRVIRLSKDPGTSSFYFHQNAYTEKGDKIVVSNREGLWAVDLTTLGDSPCTMELIVPGGGRSGIVGTKSRQVYYLQRGSLFATHLDTKATREIVKLPAGLSGASGLALNADETLVASTGNDPKARELLGATDQDKPAPKAVPFGKNGKTFTPGGRSMVLFTIDLKSGAINRIHYSVDWLNHTQFSPTDPQRLLFCHEGTWDLVDRIWTIKADGTGLRKIHYRTMDREIFGHEFFGFDGKSIWYDLQTPRSKAFWLAGKDLETGIGTRYLLERSQWSVHYNQSRDGTLFCGDGGGPKSVAAGGNGQWIYLFTPEKDYRIVTEPNPRKNADDPAEFTWREGKFAVEKLVDLGKHDYQSEPNATFTPDNKWIVFRSNLHGAGHTYAVEVKRSK